MGTKTDLDLVVEAILRECAGMTPEALARALDQAQQCAEALVTRVSGEILAEVEVRPAREKTPC